MFNSNGLGLLCISYAIIALKKPALKVMLLAG
jgi:hypothetical protein